MVGRFIDLARRTTGTGRRRARWERYQDVA